MPTLARFYVYPLPSTSGPNVTAQRHVATCVGDNPEVLFPTSWGQSRRSISHVLGTIPGAPSVRGWETPSGRATIGASCTRDCR